VAIQGESLRATFYLVNVYFIGYSSSNVELMSSAPILDALLELRTYWGEPE